MGSSEVRTRISEPGGHRFESCLGPMSFSLLLRQNTLCLIIYWGIHGNPLSFPLPPPLNPCLPLSPSPSPSLSLPLSLPLSPSPSLSLSLSLSLPLPLPLSPSPSPSLSLSLSLSLPLPLPLSPLSLSLSLSLSISLSAPLHAQSFEILSRSIGWGADLQSSKLVQGKGSNPLKVLIKEK